VKKVGSIPVIGKRVVIVLPRNGNVFKQMLEFSTENFSGHFTETREKMAQSLMLPLKGKVFMFRCVEIFYVGKTLRRLLSPSLPPIITGTA
jgi:hypothetical protein